jgi:TetR/AcrR family transcriptional regulator, cholesterol catabolism regulator
MESRLLAEAALLFRQRGFAASSTRMLAQRVGLQSASIYHYVKTKEDLLYRICIKSLERISGHVKAAQAGAVSPLDALGRAMHAHIESAIADRDMHATMLIDMRALSAARRGVVAHKRADHVQLLENVIRDAQSTGDLRGDFTAHELTLALLNLLNWTIFWYRPDGEISVDRLCELLTKIYIEGAARE